jgi:Cu-Zn family superoxide dismutase
MHRLTPALTAAALLAACQSLPTDPAGAVAELRPTSGHEAQGRVRFTATGAGVQVHALVTGLTPNREHGFHVHEAGDCSAADASSAKGHFDPHSRPHGHYQAASHHAGDMPNLRADASGRAEAIVVLNGVSLHEGPSNIVGRSVIVHAQPDDYRSQPAGNAGARVACGVIRLR